MADRLSPLEKGILRAFCDGKGATEIASELGVTEAAVDHHVLTSLRKVDATTRAEAVLRAYRAGALDRAPQLSALADPPRRGPARLERVRALAVMSGRWVFAAILFIAAVVGILGAARGPALFHLGPATPIPVPTLVPPAERAP